MGAPKGCGATLMAGLWIEGFEYYPREVGPVPPGASIAVWLEFARLCRLAGHRAGWLDAMANVRQNRGKRPLGSGEGWL